MAGGAAATTFYDGAGDSESMRSGRRGNSCCGCVALIICVLILFVLLGGGIFFAFLQSNLPQVRFQRLDVHKLNISRSGNGHHLTADLSAYLNITNGNGKVELGYNSLAASLSVGNVNFPKVKLRDMRQRPHWATRVKVRTAVDKKAVEEAEVKELQEYDKAHMMVLNLVVKGTVSFFVSGSKLIALPFKMDCHSIDQSEVDMGHAPKCRSQMTLS